MQNPQELNARLFSALESNTNIDYKKLLQEGADPNAMSDRDGNTCLHLIIKHKKKDLIKLFLKHGADPHKKNNDGQTPIQYALCCAECYPKDLGYKDAIKEIRVSQDNPDHDGNFDVLMWAIKNKHLETSNIFLTETTVKFCDPNTGQTPLHLAIECGLPKEFIDTIINNGNENIFKRDSKEQTPAMIAAVLGKWDYVKQIINKRKTTAHSTRNTFDEYGFLLLYAVLGGHRVTTQLLLENNTNINYLSDLGKTPLDIAEENHNSIHLLDLKNRKNAFEIIKLLKQHNAKSSKEIDQTQPIQTKNEKTTVDIVPPDNDGPLNPVPILPENIEQPSKIKNENSTTVDTVYHKDELLNSVPGYMISANQGNNPFVLNTIPAANDLTRPIMNNNYTPQPLPHTPEQYSASQQPYTQPVLPFWNNQSAIQQQVQQTPLLAQNNFPQAQLYQQQGPYSLPSTSLYPPQQYNSFQQPYPPQQYNSFQQPYPPQQYNSFQQPYPPQQYNSFQQPYPQSASPWWNNQSVIQQQVQQPPFSDQNNFPQAPLYPPQSLPYEGGQPQGNRSTFFQQPVQYQPVQYQPVQSQQAQYKHNMLPQ